MGKLFPSFVLSLIATTGFAATPNTPESTETIDATVAEKITVTYKGEHDVLTPFERGFAEFNGLKYFELHLGSKWTLASLTAVACRDGQTTEEVLFPEGFAVTGVSKFAFYAQGISADSVKVMIVTDGGMRMSPNTLQLPNNKHYILMETYDSEGAVVVRGEEPGDISVEYPTGVEIPLIAYTTGLSREMEFGGQKSVWIDYCGLRDKHAHPSRWYGEFGIDNYIYYIAKFE